MKIYGRAKVRLTWGQKSPRKDLSRSSKVTLAPRAGERLSYLWPPLRIWCVISPLITPLLLRSHNPSSNSHKMFSFQMLIVFRLSVSSDISVSHTSVSVCLTLIQQEQNKEAIILSFSFVPVLVFAFVDFLHCNTVLKCSHVFLLCASAMKQWNETPPIMWSGLWMANYWWRWCDITLIKLWTNDFPHSHICSLKITSKLEIRGKHAFLVTNRHKTFAMFSKKFDEEKKSSAADQQWDR